MIYHLRFSCSCLKTVFSADYDFGFEILNVSDLPSVNLLSRSWLSSGFFGVYVEDNYAYFTSNSILNKGLHIYDVANVSNPLFVKHYPLDGDPCDLQVVERVAYIADNEHGLILIDVSDPNSPTHQGNFTDGGRPFDVEVHGNIVYVAGLDDGLEIVEIMGLGENNVDGYNLLFISGTFFTMIFVIRFLKKRRVKSSVN
jgi:hypothetical protein